MTARRREWHALHASPANGRGKSNRCADVGRTWQGRGATARTRRSLIVRGRRRDAHRHPPICPRTRRTAPRREPRGQRNVLRERILDARS